MFYNYHSCTCTPVRCTHVHEGTQCTLKENIQGVVPVVPVCIIFIVLCVVPVYHVVRV